VILVAAAGFTVLILGTGSITLLTAWLLTALLLTALAAALAALLAAARVASLRGAGGGILSRIALRLVAVLRIILRSVAIGHLHASCIELLGRILQERLQHGLGRRRA